MYIHTEWIICMCRASTDVYEDMVCVHSKSLLQLLLQLVRLRFFFSQFLNPSRRSARDRFFTTKRLERIVKDPFSGVLDRFIKNEW